MNDQDDAASNNLLVVMRRTIDQPRINGVALYYFLQGIRIAIKQSGGRAIQDPFRDTLREVHRAAVHERGHPVAAQIIFHLTAALTEEDQRLAARTILTANY